MPRSSLTLAITLVACTGKGSPPTAVEHRGRTDETPSVERARRAEPSVELRFGPICTAYLAAVTADCAGVDSGLCQQAGARVRELRHLPAKDGSHESYDWLCETELKRLRGENALPLR